MPMDQFVRELLTADGSTYSEPGRQLLPDQPRPRELGRDDRPALPGRPHPVCQVPQPPVRALDPGRLLRLRRLLLAGRPKNGNLPDEEVVYCNHAGDVRQPRTGKMMKPKALGGPTSTTGKSRPPRPPGVLADRPGESVLRQEPGQPGLVPPDRPGDRRAGRRLPRLQPRLQRRAARRPDRRVRQERLRPQGADPLDPAQPDLPALAHTNELNADDTLYFSHAQTKLLAGRGAARRHLDRHRHDHRVRRPSQGRACHPDSRRQDGEPVPQDLRPARTRAGLRVRARERLEPLAGPAAHRRRDGQRQAPRRQRPDGPARQERQVARGDHRELYLVALGREPNATELAAAVKHLRPPPTAARPSRTWAGS